MTMETANFARHLVVPGTSNFRDLGGYVGHGGRTVRWRTLFRSDHLADLTPQALAQLAELGVVRAVDFRGEMERSAHGYDWAQLDIHALTVEPTVVQKAMVMLQSGGRLSVDDTVVLMQDTYRSFVRENAPRFAQWLALLQAQAVPTVFHCTAGKDRTGWAAALVLHVLGVPREVVQQDYLLTNQYYQRPTALVHRAGQGIPDDILQVLWKVQPAFLDSAYALVDGEYGGMDAYVREVLGVDDAAQQQLRALYLQE